MTDTTEDHESQDDKRARFTQAMAGGLLIAKGVPTFESAWRDMATDLRRMDSVGAILDPTMYRDFLYDDHRQKNATLIGCLLRFAADLRKCGVIE